MCVGCGREGKYICKLCQSKLVRPEPICPMCTKASLDGMVHARCRSRYCMDRLIVGLPYKGMVQKCLKKVKYQSDWDIVQDLVEMCSFGRQEAAAVTCVPMWSAKQRRRGFNQAEMIAKQVALINKGQSDVYLERTKETKPMFGLTKPERQKNIANAFRFVGQNCPEMILLVDDVWTTGATMRECARVLKQNGVKEVCGVALAR